MPLTREEFLRLQSIGAVVDNKTVPEAPTSRTVAEYINKHYTYFQPT